jgi:hypothetical protein
MTLKHFNHLKKIIRLIDCERDIIEARRAGKLKGKGVRVRG